MTDRCPTCGAERSGTYCSDCGQPRIDHSQRTFVQIVTGIIRDLVGLDGPFLRSFRLLLSRPGVMAAEIVQGRTTPYLAPFKLYALISAAYFLLAWRPGLEMMQFDDQIATVISRYLTDRPDLQESSSFRHAVEDRYLDYFAVSRFANVLIISAAAALLFRSPRTMFGDHNVFVLHYASFDYMTNTVVILVLMGLHAAGVAAGYPVSLLMLTTLCYVILAAFRFYEGSRFGLLWRSAVLFLVDIITTQLASAVALAAAIFITIRSLP